MTRIQVRTRPAHNLILSKAHLVVDVDPVQIVLYYPSRHGVRRRNGVRTRGRRHVRRAERRHDDLHACSIVLSLDRCALVVCERRPDLRLVPRALEEQERERAAGRSV